MNNMNLLAFLFALVNVQNMQSSGQPIRNMAVKLGDLRSLKNDLELLPGFEIEKFRNTGFYRDGDIGRYVSKNLRDYIYEGIGHANDEGVILTIYYDEESDSSEPDDNGILIRGVTSGNQEKSELDHYFERKHARANGRSLLDKMRF